MEIKTDKENLSKLINKVKKEKNELGEIIYPILNNHDLSRKEILEVCQIGRFVYKIDSEIKIIDKPKPPSPDFIIKFNNKLIGLEHTRILTKDAQRYFKIKTLLRYAEQMFKQKYPNINVHATISIRNDEWDYSQKNKPILAEKIADYVRLTMINRRFELPEKITRLKTTKSSGVSFTYKEKKWQADYLTRERLKIEIGKKETKISRYKTSKKRMDGLWLILLAGSLSSVSYQIDEFENYRMESKFNRVYLMADFEARILRVK